MLAEDDHGGVERREQASAGTVVSLVYLAQQPVAEVAAG